MAGRDTALDQQSADIMEMIGDRNAYDVARDLGIPNGTFSRWKNGEGRMPWGDTMFRLARLTDRVDVLAKYAEPSGFAVVKVPSINPDDLPSMIENLSLMANRLSKETGDVARCVCEATDPDGEGGSSVTGREWGRLYAEAWDLVGYAMVVALYAKEQMEKDGCE